MTTPPGDVWSDSNKMKFVQTSKRLLDAINEASMESFPGSDAPARTAVAR